MRLEDKVAVVTGSSTGIGRSIAERFAREGADVVINYRRSEDEAQACLKAVEQTGRRGIVVRADMAQVADVQRLIDRAKEEFGRVDVLVANAGVEKECPASEVDEDLWDWVMDVNVKGAFFCAQRAAKYMTEAGGGRIIFMSSTHEEMPFPLHTPYCASKGAMKMLMRNLAVEYAPHGITVNNIAPGAIKTPINAPLLSDPERTKKLLENIPLGRLGEPSDVDGVAVFLASDEAKYVTASTYYVDGGLLWNYEE